MPYIVIQHAESKLSAFLVVASIAFINSRYKCHLATGAHESQQVDLGFVNKFRFSHRALIVESACAVERLGLCAGIVQEKSSNAAWRELEGQVSATMSAFNRNMFL